MQRAVNRGLPRERLCIVSLQKGGVYQSPVASERGHGGGGFFSAVSVSLCLCVCVCMFLVARYPFPPLCTSCSKSQSRHS
jgi:hypothetical protein